MTRSVYVIGGAGTGKSTFTQALLDRAGADLGPLLDLHQTPNSRGTLVTLRGHAVGDRGLYLGLMRDEFPGTDGLDRVSGLPGEEWLATEAREEVGWILGEGATLSTRRFLYALAEHTDLLLIHLWVEDFVRELWIAQRGSEQDEKFVTATATRAANLVPDLRDKAARILEAESSSEGHRNNALDRASEWLGF